jgi:hypothetical protein
MGAELAPLQTREKDQNGLASQLEENSLTRPAILHDPNTCLSVKQSLHNWESLSKTTFSTPKAEAREAAQPILEASTCRGIVVSTFLDKTNNTVPLQSLTTTAIEEHNS